jgi:hypothetical protein
LKDLSGTDFKYLSSNMSVPFTFAARQPPLLPPPTGRWALSFSFSISLFLFFFYISLFALSLSLFLHQNENFGLLSKYLSGTVFKYLFSNILVPFTFAARQPPLLPAPTGRWALSCSFSLSLFLFFFYTSLFALSLFLFYIKIILLDNCWMIFL